MRTKRCKLCGAIIYDPDAGDVCEVCMDDMDARDEEVETDGKT